MYSFQLFLPLPKYLFDFSHITEVLVEYYVNMVGTWKGTNTPGPSNKITNKKNVDKNIDKVVTNVHDARMKGIVIRGNFDCRYGSVSSSVKVKLHRKSLTKVSYHIPLSMSDLYGEVSELLIDGEANKESGVINDPLLAMYNIEISIFTIERPHNIVQGNPMKFVTTSETIIFWWE